MSDRKVEKLPRAAQNERVVINSTTICRTDNADTCLNNTSTRNSFSALTNNVSDNDELESHNKPNNHMFQLAPPLMHAVIGKLETKITNLKNTSNVRTAGRKVAFDMNPVVALIPLEWFEYSGERNRLLKYPNPPRKHQHNYTSNQLKYSQSLFAAGVEASRCAINIANELVAEINKFAILSRIVDTGAGGHLIGLNDASNLPQESISPQRFSTASGITISNAVTKEKLNDLGPLTSHILQNSPNALSVGCLVNENNIGFSWLPCNLTPEQIRALTKIKNGVPTFVLPNGKLQELRVEGNVPIHDEATISISAVAASSSSSSSSAVDPSVFADAVVIPPSPEPITPHVRKPKEPHNLVTHLPACADCEICRIAKQKREASRVHVLDESDFASEWGQKIMFDHFIGAEPCLTIYDEGTNTIGFYPCKSRKASEVEAAFRKFCGADLDKVKLLYSDNAPEFKKLAKKLKLAKRTSTPRRPKTNARMENKQLLIGNGIKTSMLQSGLNRKFWKLAGAHFCDTYTFSHHSKTRTVDTPYNTRYGHEKKFDGHLQPFGCACSYVPPESSKAHKDEKPDPRGVDCIFLGYHMQDGNKFTGDYTCVRLDYFLKPNIELETIRTRDLKFPPIPRFPIKELKDVTKIAEFYKHNPIMEESEYIKGILEIGTEQHVVTVPDSTLVMNDPDTEDDDDDVEDDEDETETTEVENKTDDKRLEPAPVVETVTVEVSEPLILQPPERTVSPTVLPKAVKIYGPKKPPDISASDWAKATPQERKAASDLYKASIEQKSANPSVNLPKSIIEFCCSPNSTISSMAQKFGAKGFRLSLNTADLFTSAGMKTAHDTVIANPGCHVWCSIPCSPWSRWQSMNLHRLGPKYQQILDQKRLESKWLLKNYFKIAELAIALGGGTSFEWPRFCDGWNLPELNAFAVKHNLFIADCDGCALGMKSKKGEPYYKPWRIITTSETLASALKKHRCTKDHIHCQIAGKETERSGFYSEDMAKVILGSVFKPNQNNPDMKTVIPCMACSPVAQEDHLDNFSDEPFLYNAFVSRLLTSKEIKGSQRALDAIKAEAAGLKKLGTWNEAGVREWSDVAAEARREGRTIHVGRLFAIGTIKHSELPEEKQIYKGRIVFQGSNVKDQSGMQAMFQQLSSSPASMSAGKNNVSYGCLPGNKSQQCDAVKAYIQADLKGHATWVRIPVEFRPESWSKYRDPVCPLIKALYGHPDSGGYWEIFSQKQLALAGFSPVADWPSTFFHKEWKLLLTVYVDDFLLSGPEQNLARGWEAITKVLTCEEPTELGRYLACQHECSIKNNQKIVSYDMEAYMKQCVERYCEVAGSDKVKIVPSPFINEDMLLPSDFESKGLLGEDACSVLMKLLYAARLARPDIMRAITELASCITKWTVACDKKLYRLICYVHASLKLRLLGKCSLKPENLELNLFVDADFAGDKDSSKSTNGFFMALIGENTFLPLGWSSKKQSCVAHSTTEAEIVAADYGLKSEAIPVLTLWEMLLGKPKIIKIREDNTAAAKIMQSGYSPQLRYLSRTQRVDISWIHGIIESKLAEVVITPTKEQVADVFTKPLEVCKWEDAVRMLNMFRC